MSMPHGIINDGDPDQVLIRRDYLQWLASVLNETCNCGPHIDHADCISEVQCFINYFGGVRPL